MSNQPELVLKTTDPAAVEAYRKQNQQRIDEHRKRVEVMRELSIGFAPDPEAQDPDIRSFYTSTDWAGVIAIRGIASLRSERTGETPIPDGWRIEKKYDMLVPALAKKRGKEIRDLMQSARGEAMASLGALVGMPDMVFFGGGDATFTTRPLYVQHEDALYVLWTTETALTDIKKVGADNPIHWDKIKLSEWYLVKETIEEERAQ